MIEPRVVQRPVTAQVGPIDGVHTGARAIMTRLKKELACCVLVG
jgi:hypothetical protein